MAGYTKLFNSILASTIWLANDKTRIVWITLLAMADKNGIAEGSVPGLAAFARVSTPACRKALAELMAPDRDSRSTEFDGRRIEPVDGGWRLLNHAKYRERLNTDERREYFKLKKREARLRGGSKRVKDMSTHVQNVQDKSTVSTQAEAEANTKANTEAVQARVRTPGAPLHDNSHRKHAHCGRVCLPASLFSEFVRRRNHDGADQELRDWALTVERAWADRSEEPGDAFDFWKTRYGEQWPTVKADKWEAGLPKWVQQARARKGASS